MRKRIIPSGGGETTSGPQDWLDLEDLVEIEMTSEDAAHPIESALQRGAGAGWRAAGPGPQTVRLRFTRPQPLSRIRLEFVETAVERTQEYVLRWSGDGGQSYADLVRQQWTFSPGGSTRQAEDHRVDLAGVTVLELTIVPDISRGPAVASLAALRVA